VRDTISNSATVLNHFAYDSFGDLEAHSSPVAATEDLFTGREFSTSALVGYFRARYYSPDIGRFLSEDALDPYNYPYAGNNPSTLKDPMGLADVEYEETTAISRTVVRPVQTPWTPGYWSRGTFEILNDLGWQWETDSALYQQLVTRIMQVKEQLFLAGLLGIW
jgi:RHS repeat-associated protein